MKLHIVASGSKANCYILDADGDKLILDAGVRFSVLQQALGYDYAGVCGCLVTHDHKDHTRCIGDVMRAGIPAYMSAGTAVWSLDKNDHPHIVEDGSSFQIGPFYVIAFGIQHDCAEPLGFYIHYSNNEKFIYATDIYYLKPTFPGAQYFLIECNYVTERLFEQHAAGEITDSLYKRLLTSHMSLENLKAYFTKAPPSCARKIVLCHLSDARSDEERMAREIGELTGVDTVAAADGMIVELNKYPF